MFTKYIKTGHASVTGYRKVTDWDTVWGVIVIGIILIAIIAS